MKTMMKKLLTAALLTLSLSAASALAEPLDAFKGLSGWGRALRPSGTPDVP